MAPSSRRSTGSFASATRSRLHAAEVEYLRARGAILPDAEPVRGSIRDVAGGVAVDFAFRYLGRKAGTRRTFALASSATVFVERLDLNAVGRGVTLTTRHSLALPFVRHDGGWYRPLVAPNGKGFMDEDAFAAACAGMEPWTDDPFRVKPALGTRPRVPVAVLEGASPEGADALPNAARRDAEALSCMERAGRLVSVEGMVHVRCPEPALALVTQQADDVSRRRYLPVLGIHVSVGWASGSVDSGTDFGLLPARQGMSPFWPEDHRVRWPTFPLGHLGMAEVAGMAYADGIGATFQVVKHEVPETGEDAVATLEAALASMPLGGDVETSRTRMRDDILRHLRSGDWEGLTRFCAALKSTETSLLSALAGVSILALKGEYDAAPVLDVEAEVAALAP